MFCKDNYVKKQLKLKKTTKTNFIFFYTTLLFLSPLYTTLTYRCCYCWSNAPGPGHVQ